jgi:hypothetical protein
MAFSTTSFFAGVGTVFAAITLGFAGGAMITGSPKVEPNKLERAAAAAPTPAPVAPAKADTAETASAPDRVVSTTPQSTPASVMPESTPQPVPPQPQPVVARDDGASQVDNAKKAREAELKKENELRRAERRAEHRRAAEWKRRQEIQAAANAVRRLQRDNDLQEVSQRDEPPRFGFFGND